MCPVNQFGVGGGSEFIDPTSRSESHRVQATRNPSSDRYEATRGRTGESALSVETIQPLPVNLSLLRFVIPVAVVIVIYFLLFKRK